MNTLQLVLESPELEDAYEYIRLLRRTCTMATTPPLPGCVNAATIPWDQIERQWMRIDPNPLQAIRVYEVYLSASPIPEAPEIPVRGVAILDGERVGLCPAGVDWKDAEPLWIDAQPGHASRLLQDVVIQAGRRKIPIFPTALYVVKDDRYPYPLVEDGWFVRHQVSSKETSAALVGCAVHKSRVVYIHMAGPQASVKSIAASLIQGKTVATTDYPTMVQGVGPYRMFLSPIPETKSYRCILVETSALEAEKAENGWAYLLVPRWKDHDIASLFAQRLNNLLPVPIIPEWGDNLLAAARNAGLVSDLATCGDVAGLAIRMDVDWIDFLNHQIAEKVLTI